VRRLDVSPAIDIDGTFGGEKPKSKFPQGNKRVLRELMTPQRIKSSPMTVAAAHCAVHSRAREQTWSAPVVVLPARVTAIEAIMRYNLGYETLVQISALIREDGDQQTLEADYNVLYNQPAIAALLARQTLALRVPLEQDPVRSFGEVRRDWHIDESDEILATLVPVTLQLIQRHVKDEFVPYLNYSVAEHTKIALVLRVMRWAVQLTYLASTAGSLAVRPAALYDYETTKWGDIKLLLVAFAKVLERDTAVRAYERLLRALTVEIFVQYQSRDKDAALAYERLAKIAAKTLAENADSTTPFLKYSALAIETINTVLPTLADERRRFYTAVTNAVGSSLRAISTFNGRCAALFAAAGTLARGINYNAAGERHGIDVSDFGDTLHAALDVSAHITFNNALPIVTNQSVIFAALALDASSK
jgi:hypothetical protein